MFNALTDAKRTMKATLFSFSVEDIHYEDITDSKSVEERKSIFGTYYLFALFMVCELIPYLFLDSTLFRYTQEGEGLNCSCCICVRI